MSSDTITQAQYLRDRQALLHLLEIACSLRSQNPDLVLRITQALVLLRMMETRMQEQQLRDISIQNAESESESDMPELESPGCEISELESPESQPPVTDPRTREHP